MQILPSAKLRYRASCTTANAEFYKVEFMKTRRFVFFATLLLVSAITGLFAKPNPKAASYKTHEVSTSSTNASDKSAPLVYFIRDISPESLVKVFQATGYKTSDKVGVKVSTGESENSNYLRPTLIKNAALLRNVLGAVPKVWGSPKYFKFTSKFKSAKI